MSHIISLNRPQVQFEKSKCPTEKCQISLDEFVSGRDASQGIHFRKHLRVYLLRHIPHYEGYSRGPLDRFFSKEAEKVLLRLGDFLPSDFEVEAHVGRGENIVN